MLLGLIDLRDDTNVYWLSAAAMLGVLFGLRRLINSPFGMMLIAIRDNERRALSLGHNVDGYKLVAFGIAAFCAGVAGSMSAVVFQLATLSGVHWHLSGEAVLMALIGGIGTFCGPLVGAAVLVTMQHFLSPFGAWIVAIQGAVFVLCVLLFRDGLLPHALALAANLRRKDAAPKTAAVAPQAMEAIGQ